MNRLPDISSGLERLSRAAESSPGDDPRAATFARSLVLGALVGAAIAGSTIWQRRRQAGTGPPVDEVERAQPGH